jgi:hypothetical protein
MSTTLRIELAKSENVQLEGKRDLSPGSAIVEDIEDDSKAVNDSVNRCS